MAITNTWHDEEQTILYTRVTGRWTLDEHYLEFEAGMKMIRDVNHPVMLIIDLSDSAAPPTQFMSTGRRMSTNRPDHLVNIIIVNNNRLMQMLIDIIGKIYSGDRRPLFFTDTNEALETARSILATRG